MGKKLESAYSFMLKYYKTNVFIDLTRMHSMHLLRGPWPIEKLPTDVQTIDQVMGLEWLMAMAM